MDIFVIDRNSAKNVSKELLLEFKKKEISNEKTLITHCFSYLMLDRILKENYGIKNREIVFENRKPFLKTKELYFSISHSGDYIAIAISKYNCGIDIEKNKKRDYKKIADYLKFEINSEEEFYIEWTKYEALYKLNNKEKSLKTFQIKEYTLTAMSEEKTIFNLFVQNSTLH